MEHQNFQEAIAQLSTNDVMDSNEMKKHFNLNEEDMKAIQSSSPVTPSVTQASFVPLCCCCMQSDN
jgi:hypothetical protein